MSRRILILRLYVRISPNKPISYPHVSYIFRKLWMSAIFKEKESSGAACSLDVHMSFSLFCLCLPEKTRSCSWKCCLNGMEKNVLCKQTPLCALSNSALSIQYFFTNIYIYQYLKIFAVIFHTTHPFVCSNADFRHENENMWNNVVFKLLVVLEELQQRVLSILNESSGHPQ